MKSRLCLKEYLELTLKAGHNLYNYSGFDR